jgi:hypothetical protein
LSVSTTGVEIRDRLLAPASLRDADGNVIGFDVGALVRRLILFETYIHNSHAMQELPYLIEAIGPHEFIKLLESGALRIRADAWTVGQIGQTGLPIAGSPTSLPLGTYAFERIVQGGREGIESRLGEIRSMDLDIKTSKKVRNAIVDALVPAPDTPGVETLEQFALDVAAASPTLYQATALALTKHTGQPVGLGAFTFRVEQVDHNVYATETDIGKRFGLNEMETHKVVEQGLFGASSVNQRLEMMNFYGAVTGFVEDELPVFERKLERLIAPDDPDRHEARFDRVITLADMPDVSTQAAAGIDIDRLLELRASEECREFRQWVRSLDSATDAEIAEQVHSIREKFSAAVHSDAGKAVRFAATTGVGVIFPPAGLVLGALDQFLVDRVVPEPGPISFLGRSYPSIFRD